MTSSSAPTPTPSLYTRTARLGEGVIFVQAAGLYRAALILEQHSDTVVDLWLLPVINGVHTWAAAVEMGTHFAIDHPDNIGKWLPRPKT